jgi:hypothetical protein
VRFASALFVAFAILASPIGAHAAGSAAVRDGAHDFDFAIGNWTTEVTITPDPFNHPDQQSHMTGSKVARPLWNGKGLLEEIEAGQGADHWQGATLFLYDPKAGQWSQNYADADTGRMDAIPSIGGRAMLVRGTWRILSPDLHTYEIDRSIDGARSWHQSFFVRVMRRK